ncbi:phosphopyruvate hydratase [Candidatus Uhrbacteria bacterium RIFCSPHIGHO2_02_FULL_47_44]|uniref:Enolase n=1 Tax=Candidatus Uhrbacteria bacterium RIFCSPLOWO2_02_FULL_48_18 TaxID=1802408 RepID=A0A1F7V8W7_9BACT|nr:MAG: phosphopyruvate hydratase [Candidatus Uhrbacteria bacterium RIFCSPHIGHO2_02_FULL_47_44]OGL77417.1 MAG: phosphopyruvate hydratase [Candidatus Uhrbacteria bacterium RIFCSPHIGHO2_12_FULL_47_12]OGL81777.1 MAG: phosphopyruvate hydratase [Candidatus Uhrbacteria bacterium RIFCSPLOWO2_01_FULL_47_17]OGL86940.1 MAG: phosphopyruvate hydratase [Candidatus Uhrbacteria bacterium RIFCSPLOWO2_02_FULL_48_18]OGL94339.1 MAG: phosphopyruvate hydratase [Candidatus Uhrbacteria bacterium RIFCSPLOWO2_12_FULL_4
MSKIESIHAHEILDSRGNPTVNVTVLLEDGTSGSASVPSGASTGIHEALELRDGDAKRYNGQGVLKAVKHVNGLIAKVLVGMDVMDQRKLDVTMIALDGTPNKSKLGANAILGVSLACAHAAARSKKMPLYAYLRTAFDLPYKNYRMPIPTMNVLNGGAHAGWILDFQEFMIVPTQKKFKERVRCGAEIFHALGGLLKKKGFSTLKGDEGGYAVPFKKNEDAFVAIMQAIRLAGYKAGKDVFLAMDPAVSELYDAKSKRYKLRVDKKSNTSKDMIAMWKKWLAKYPIISLEDGLDQDDWAGWTELTRQLGKKTVLVGDDFFVTNSKRLAEGIEKKAANAILIKLNQIGSLSETIDTILLAQQYGYKVSVSHRSGETADTTLADLAVAVNADYIKTGSLSRSERLEKYNRVMEIEEEVKK